MSENRYAVRQDSISLTLTLLAGAVFLYAFTWGEEFQNLTGFLIILLSFGLVMNVAFLGRVPRDERVDEKETGTILIYSVLALGVITVGNYVVPAFLPSILLQAYEKLNVIDARLFGILIAVSEEQFFRGFLAPYMANRFGLTLGTILQGVLFGAYHLAVYNASNQALAIVSFSGIILGYVALKTQRLSPCILAHALVNAISAGG